MRVTTFLYAFVFIAVCFPLVCCDGPVPIAPITNLPGAPPLNFSQYSGYINVDEKNGRYLFYWFVESQVDPDSAPLLLWQTGGPGCSSIAALLAENGPFTIQPDGATLKANPFSWNTFANVLYVESPANVGFSFSNTPSDNNVGDYRTADDIVTFLVGFLGLMPQYANSPLWLVGESYGGHYVPWAAWAMVQYNQYNPLTPLNLMGFSVGNAWTVAPLDNAGAAYMWWTHGIISDEIYNGINNNCDFANIGPLSQRELHELIRHSETKGPHGGQRTAQGSGGNPTICNDNLSQASNLMAGLNIYDLYADICLHPPSSKGQSPIIGVGEQLMRYLSPPEGDTNGAFNVFGKRSLATSSRKSKVSPSPFTQYPDPDPCIDYHMNTYMNNPDVQKALNVYGVPYAWAMCSNTLNYSRSDLLSSMMPIYEKLMMGPTLSLNVYSGDIDGIVPITGTRMWLNASPFNVSQAWYTWTDSNGQTGGWLQQYEYGTSTNNLLFITIRDAGHMAPYFQPGRSLDMIKAVVLNGGKF